MPRFSAVKMIIDDIDTLTMMRKKNPQDLELLWLKIRRLNEMFGSGNNKQNDAVIEKSDCSCEEVPVVICFQPTALSVEIKSNDKSLVKNVQYHQHSRLLSLVHEFFEVLIASGEPGLVDVLEHTDPYCFMCGACCRSYDIDTTAVDIERIADHLKISEKEVWEKYLMPGTRSWNRRDGFIRRHKKENSEGDCLFLKTKSPAESVCGIYEARSQVCRDYKPGTRLCQKQSLLLRGYEHMGYIISCRIADDIISITTHHTVSQNKEPYAIALKDNNRLREMFHKVKEEVLQLIPD